MTGRCQVGHRTHRAGAGQPRHSIYRSDAAHMPIRRRPGSARRPADFAAPDCKISQTSASHRWPLDRHTTDARPATVRHVRNKSAPSRILSIRIKVQGTFKCDCDRPIARFADLYTPTSTRRPLHADRCLEIAHAARPPLKV